MLGGRGEAGRWHGSSATTMPATPMWDPATGGGYDGLIAHGPNLNQGAESTLALISTMQHARRLNLSIDCTGQTSPG